MWGKIKTSLSWNILIGIGAIGAISGLFGIARETIALRREYTAAMVKIEALRKERASLSGEIAALETPEVIEREAKEKFNLKKKGEQVVIVVPERLAQEPQPAIGWWQKLRDIFSHLLRK